MHQLETISVKSLVSLNACVRVIYFPPTAMVIRRRSQFIVSSERLDNKSSSCFAFNGPLRQYFSLYRAVSQREVKRGEI